MKFSLAAPLLATTLPLISASGLRRRTAATTPTTVPNLATETTATATDGSETSTPLTTAAAAATAATTISKSTTPPTTTATTPPTTTATTKPTDADTNGNEIVNTPGYNFHVALSQKEFDVYPNAGQIRTIDPADISNSTMGFGYLELLPGGVRELHWHPFSTEWGYITDGECRFTLMDNNGNYENGYARKGDIWNFPTSWGHSIQGVHPEDGCKMALFFSAPYIPTVNDISFSQMMTAFPIEVLEENLGAPASVIETFYQKDVNVSPGPFPPPEFPKTTSPLAESPIFHTSDGHCADIGDGAYLYEIRKENFPGITELSGGYMHMEGNKTLRDIHWHPNANEMHFVLEGKLKVGIYSIDGVFNEYILEAGDVGFVPKGMAHYFQTLTDEVDLLLAFDDPSWSTQELSTFLATTPSYITAASINTTAEVVEEYFPKTAQEFYGGKFTGCPATGKYF